MTARSTTGRSRARRIAGLASVVVGVLALATACSGPSAPTAPLVADPAHDIEGTVTVWTWEVADAALKDAIPAFTKEYPNITVDVVTVGWPAIYDKISVGLNAGQSLPDVVTLEIPRAASYFEQFPRGFVDLSEVGASLKPDFSDTLWQGSSSSDGRLLSLPWGDGPAALFYRLDYFEQAGIDPASIATWDDYIAAGEKIQSKLGKKLFAEDIGGDLTIFPLLMQQQGASYFDAAGNITLDSPEALRAVELLKRMYDDGLIDNQKGADGANTAIASGIATVPGGIWYAGILAGVHPELAGKFGVAPLPAFDKGGNAGASTGQSMLAIPSAAKNPEAAWAFIKFVATTPSVAEDQLTNQSLFPALTSALDSAAVTAPQAYFADQPIYQTVARTVATMPPFRYTGDSAEADSIVHDMLANVILNGAEPKAALAAAAEQLANATGRKLG